MQKRTASTVGSLHATECWSITNAWSGKKSPVCSMQNDDQILTLSFQAFLEDLEAWSQDLYWCRIESSSISSLVSMRVRIEEDVHVCEDTLKHNYITCTFQGIGCSHCQQTNLHWSDILQPHSKTSLNKDHQIVQQVHQRIILEDEFKLCENQHSIVFLTSNMFQRK